MRRAGIMLVSLDVITKHLPLPPGVRLVGIEQEVSDRLMGQVQFVLEGGELPECPEGSMLPYVDACGALVSTMAAHHEALRALVTPRDRGKPCPAAPSSLSLEPVEIEPLTSLIPVIP